MNRETKYMHRLYRGMRRKLKAAGAQPVGWASSFRSFMREHAQNGHYAAVERQGSAARAWLSRKGLV